MTTEQLKEFEIHKGASRDTTGDAADIEKALSQIRGMTGIDVEAFVFTAKLREGRIICALGGEKGTLINCAVHTLVLLGERELEGEQDDN
jgi:hypothetical protein